MPRFAGVSRERRSRKKWQRFNGYAFAAADALCQDAPERGTHDHVAQNVDSRSIARSFSLPPNMSAELSSTISVGRMSHAASGMRANSFVDCVRPLRSGTGRQGFL